MATASNKPVVFETVAEMQEYLGGIPIDRILMNPLPGKAKEKDVIAAEARPRKRLCELIDGILVEKAMGARESLLAAILIEILGSFCRKKGLGVILGEGGMLRLFPGQVRMPDVCFISWDRIPGGDFPTAPIPNVIPNLAVEVLSPSNTAKEMERKLRDYFFAGVELAWLIDPETQTAQAYTSPNDVQRIGKSGSLDGGDVLPGFRLPLKQLFASTKRPKGR